MIYANSVGLLQNAQSHTLLTPTGERDLTCTGVSGHAPCPGCGRVTRAVLVRDFDAFHVCENEACAQFMPGDRLRALLAAMEFTPAARHGA